MPNALISSERDRHKGKKYVVCQGLVLLILFLDVWTESQWRGISLTYQSNTDPQFSPSSSLAFSHHIVRPLHIFRYSCAHTFLFFFPIIYWLFFFFICSGFCHTLKWNSHGFTCVPHPNPPSHLPLRPLPLGLPSAPGPSACLMHPTWAGDLFHSW